MRYIFGIAIVVAYAFYAPFMVEKYPLYAGSPYGWLSLALWWGNFAGISGASAFLAYHLLGPRNSGG